MSQARLAYTRPWSAAIHNFLNHARSSKSRGSVMVNSTAPNELHGRVPSRTQPWVHQDALHPSHQPKLDGVDDRRLEASGRRAAVQRCQSAPLTAPSQRLTAARQHTTTSPHRMASRASTTKTMRASQSSTACPRCARCSTATMPSLSHATRSTRSCLC